MLFIISLLKKFSQIASVTSYTVTVVNVETTQEYTFGLVCGAKFPHAAELTDGSLKWYRFLAGRRKSTYRHHLYSRSRIGNAQ